MDVFDFLDSSDPLIFSETNCIKTLVKMIKTSPDSRKTIMRKMKDKVNQRLTAGRSEATMFVDGVLTNVQPQPVRRKRASPDAGTDPLVLHRSRRAPDGRWTHVFWFWRLLAGCGAAEGWRICLCAAFNDPEAKRVFLCSTGSSQLFIKQQCTWTNNAARRGGQHCKHAAGSQEEHARFAAGAPGLSPHHADGWVERCDPASTWTAGSVTGSQMSHLRGRGNSFKMSLRRSSGDSWNNLLRPPSSPARVIVTCTFALLLSSEPLRVPVFSAGGEAESRQPLHRCSERAEEEEGERGRGGWIWREVKEGGKRDSDFIKSGGGENVVFWKAELIITQNWKNKYARMKKRRRDPRVSSYITPGERQNSIMMAYSIFWIQLPARGFLLSPVLIPH